MHNGIINLLKPPGMTSHDCVGILRKLLGMKRIGHGGTLDPGASGVLPILLGKATRLADWMHQTGKSYRAELTLGIETDTLDAAGRTTNTYPDISIPPVRLGEVMYKFLGTFFQIPPKVSSIKVEGKRMYQLTREGESVEPPSRQVTINEIHVKKIWPEDSVYLNFGSRVLFDVDCSKGTYIRSLCRDIGVALGCGAFLSFLVRTRSGPLHLKDSISFSEIEGFIAKTDYSFILPMETAVSHLQRVDLTDREAEDIIYGRSVYLGEGIFEEHVRLHNSKGLFLAIGEVVRESKGVNICSPKKVFSP